MKKWLKAALLVAVVIIVFAAGAYLTYRSGALIRPSKNTLKGLTEVQQYDTLIWQELREEDILADYNQGTYTFEEPYVFVDPYEFNPLSALLIFETDNPGDIFVNVPGKDEFSTISYQKVNCQEHCEVPILGLYPGVANIVSLIDDQGNKKELQILTEPLPIDFQNYELLVSEPEKMESGITLFTACFEHSYTALLDVNGDVRGYISNQDMGHCTSMNVLKNGRMLATGDEYLAVPYNMVTVWEFNWLGKIFAEYEVSNGIHHDLSELENGDFIATSNPFKFFQAGTREDVVIIIDRETGEITKEYDFRKILDDTREMYHHFDPDIKNAPNKDWMHLNGAIYDKENNSIIVSAATQSQVVSIDANTSEINWILGPHEQYEGNSAFMEEFLLEPIGEDFEWQWAQHNPMLLPDLDTNPDTIDLLLLDNGQSRSSEESTAVDPEENYSRGVHFQINSAEMTVEQVWQYGKSCGTDCYATFLGDANYHLETGNRMMTFGGQLRQDGEAVDTIINGVFGNIQTQSRVVEVTEAGEVVYEVAITPGKNDQSGETYQAKRMPLYFDNAYGYNLSEVAGQRLGEMVSDEMELTTLPPALFLNKIGVTFNGVHIKENRLIIDGVIGFPDGPATLGRAFVALTSQEDSFGFNVRPGLGGRFFSSIDLSALPDGEYRLSIYGGVSYDNDTQTTDMTMGHIKTEYKVTVDND